jgi:ferredoxin-type protein NapH
MSIIKPPSNKIHLKLTVSVGLFVFFVLAMIQVMLPKPMILMERFGKGWGWIEIIVLVVYSVFVTIKMSNPSESAKWRVRFWSVFSIVFFLQLILGISGITECLMTGKLHFPIPAMIVAGPVYRGELSVMVFIFLSSIVLAGPAWCSQLCYFGAFDAMLAQGKTSRQPIKNKMAIKHSILALVISIALLYKLIGLQGWIPSLSIILFAVIGIGIMLTLSRKGKKMVHCITYCPVGTVVSYMKVVSPFRLTIADSCTSCMLCSTSCKYDALTKVDILNLKPGKTCTLCGDCLNTCHASSFKFSFANMKASNAHLLYLFITISLHVIFIGLARI